MKNEYYKYRNMFIDYLAEEAERLVNTKSIGMVDECPVWTLSMQISDVLMSLTSLELFLRMSDSKHALRVVDMDKLLGVTKCLTEAMNSFGQMPRVDLIKHLEAAEEILKK